MRSFRDLFLIALEKLHDAREMPLKLLWFFPFADFYDITSCHFTEYLRTFTRKSTLIPRIFERNSRVLFLAFFRSPAARLAFLLVFRVHSVIFSRSYDSKTNFWILALKFIIEFKAYFWRENSIFQPRNHWKKFRFWREN